MTFGRYGYLWVCMYRVAKSAVGVSLCSQSVETAGMQDSVTNQTLVCVRHVSCVQRALCAKTNEVEVNAIQIPN